MKFLVFTDLHGNKAFIDEVNAQVERYNAEFVVCLGDVTDMGTAKEAAKTLSQIKCKVYAVPGNCDARDFPEKITEVAEDIHGKSVKVGGFNLVGLGGSNITIFDTPFELNEGEIDSALRPLCGKSMILATHAPGYDILDHIPGGTPVGSPTIRRIIEKYQPILALSGHIQEDRGIKKIGHTVCCNPGPAKEGYSAVVNINLNKVTITLLGPGL